MADDPTPAGNAATGGSTPANAPPPTAADPAPNPDPAKPADVPADALQDLSPADQAAIDELLKQATFDEPVPSVGRSSPSSAGGGGGDADPDLSPDAAAAAVLPDTSNFDLPSFQQVMRDAQVSSIDLLRDVELNVKIELGRSRMLVEDVLKLGEGSVVELDKLAGDPVDVFVNDRLVARGEVLVLNDNFCVRVNEIVAGVKDEGT